jgi:hypothetical protein
MRGRIVDQNVRGRELRDISTAAGMTKLRREKTNAELQ